MRFTKTCGVWCVVLGFGWVTTLLASADVAMGTAHNWWWVFLGSAAFANLMCVGTASFVLWKLAAPSGKVWAVAYAAGRRDAQVESSDNVWHLQRTSSH